MASFASHYDGRQTASQARRAPRLPPLRLDDSFATSNYMACPTDEKSQLPCIIVTPSSPCDDTEFRIHYFAPEKPSSRSWFSWFSKSEGDIALPLSVDGNYAGSRSSSCGSTKSKWLRMFLFLAIPLFIFFHLFLLPGAENRFTDVLSSHHHQEIEHIEHISTWESNDYSPEDDKYLTFTPAWDVDAASSPTGNPQTAGHATETIDIDDFTPTAPAHDTNEEATVDHQASPSVEL